MRCLAMTAATRCFQRARFVDCCSLLRSAVSLLIEYIKDNQMREWLKRCGWGKLTTERYPTLDQEMAQLKIAAAG